MEDGLFSVPARQLINIVTLAQSVLFAAFLAISPFRRAIANRFIIAALLIMATIKLDQLYQMLGGLDVYPQLGFLLTPPQWLMTPALYFLVRARIEPNFALRPRHAVHLLPALASAFYWSVVYYFQDLDAKRAFLDSGVLSAPLNALFVPLTSDLLQIAYLAAALRALETYGISLKSWFSRIHDRKADWLRGLLWLWAAVLAGHAAMTFLRRVLEQPQAAMLMLDGLNASHLAMISLLAVLGLIDHLKAPRPLAPPMAASAYIGSTQSAAQRRKLYARLQAAMADKRLYLNPDLTLQHMAATVAATPREASEAINAEGERNFFEFVNAYRVEAAKQSLREDDHARILDIAFAVGFKSKSTFNDVFKKLAQMTPSQYRRTASIEAAARSGAARDPA